MILSFLIVYFLHRCVEESVIVWKCLFGSILGLLIIYYLWVMLFSWR